MRVLVSLLLACTLLAGCEADGLIWTPPSDSADALFRIVERGRAGFIDSRGHIVIPPTLAVSSNWGQAFYDGLLSLGVAEGPFLNTRGERVLENGFYRIWDFSEGLAAALKTRDSKWGFIDHTGQFVIPPQFPFYPEGLVGSFSDGLAAIEVSGRLGYIDRSGGYVIAPRFVAGTRFEDGIARVVAEGPCVYFDYEQYDPCMRMSSQAAPSTGATRDRGRLAGPLCKWEFIDKTGKPIFAAEFEGALGFHEGLAAVKVGDLWGFVDRRGVFVIPPAFQSVHSFSNGLALVTNDKESGFIDKAGVLKMRADFFKAEPFSDGLAAVGNPDEGYIFIDLEGKQAIPERFMLASRFFHGLAHVKLGGSSPYGGGTFAYIDRAGTRVFTYKM
jgi:hypothetical protein